ncbi:MAG TPA: mechanosensitive ion channel domain-containing protein [Gemmatimonadales bacterium]|nr:mechanosensitive ion channel domain-containing protein [Gemmatimonadales bacterium]
MPLLIVIQDGLARWTEALRIDGADLVHRLVQALAIWILAWAGLRLLRLAARRIEVVVDDGDPSIVTLREKRGITIAQLLRTVGRGAVLTIACLLTLNLFINIGPLLAGAGILGLAISFGAQSLVKDFISGFFILFENQFALGDVVEASGKSGVVEYMTLRVVVLRDVDGTRHLIPNGEIKVVSNKTAGWGRAIIDVAVSGETDADHVLAVVRDETERFAAEEEWHQVLDGPAEVWGIEALGDNRVVVRAVARTRPGAQWGVARELRRRFKVRFDAEGIRLPGAPAVVAVSPAAPAGAHASLPPAAARR